MGTIHYDLPYIDREEPGIEYDLGPVDTEGEPEDKGEREDKGEPEKVTEYFRLLTGCTENFKKILSRIAAADKDTQRKIIDRVLWHVPGGTAYRNIYYYFVNAFAANAEYNNRYNNSTATVEEGK